MRKPLLPPLILAIACPLLAATKTVTFTVKGWTGGSCAAATRIALRKVDGVEEVTTNPEQREAIVVYDDAKAAPENMIQAIEKLGYKATVSAVPSAVRSTISEKRIEAGAAASPERVSFFEVPLECGAAKGLGCGSASKPILKALDGNPRVKEAKVNHSGTILAVVWNDAEQPRSGASIVEAVFKARRLETALLEGAAREKALKEFESSPWYRKSDVDRLSEREAQVIATRVVNRAKAHLGLAADELAALTRDLTSGIATILTREKDEECARDPLEELAKIAGKHLNQQQLAELRKAAEQGADALPGEAK